MKTIRKILFSCLEATVIITLLAGGLSGCMGSNNRGREYEIPGYINIQTFPMGVEDVIAVRDIIVEYGYEAIISSDFIVGMRSYDQRERYLAGLCVSEKYPVLYWRGVPVELEGGNIDGEDISNHARVCVLDGYDSEALLGSGTNAVGEKLHIKGEDFTVIGIVKGFKEPISLFIPFTTGADVGLTRDFLVLVWVDGGESLSKIAKQIHKLLKDNGISATVSFLNEDKEELGVYPADL